MNAERAKKLLGLSAHSSARDIRDAHSRRASQLGRERELAITRSLRDRIEQDLAEIKAAREFLLAASIAPKGSDLPGELPLTSPPETNHATPRSPMPFSTTGSSRVLDRYDLGEKLGSGGMGEVFAAFDRLTSQPVAIKFISDRISSRSDSLQRFLSEARLSCRLSHPNIVRTFDVHEAAGRYFITMELLEGHTLRQHISAHVAKGMAFERVEIGRILHQICAALAYAHKDLVHRDIKPENVWRCPDGTIKIMDFGVALELCSADLAEASAALGTEGYRAPEQTTGADPVDQRADQFAVGCIAVELLCAPDPCRPAQIRADKLGRRDPVRPVLERALAGRASDRFDNILTFDAALRKALLSARWRQRWHWALLPLALAAIVLIIKLASPGEAPSVEAEYSGSAGAADPELAAHARIREAQSLLAAVDTLVEHSREHLEGLRSELARAEQRRGDDTGARDRIAGIELELADAELVLRRGRGWALMGNERIAVEGELGAAVAAIESEKWREAEHHARSAAERLDSSRAQLTAVSAELSALRATKETIDALEAALGRAGQPAVIQEMRAQLGAVREQLGRGEESAARAARTSLEAALQQARTTAAVDVIRHWHARARQAIERRDYRSLRIAIDALQGAGETTTALADYRRALGGAERAARTAAELRRRQEQEARELESEQARYRPQRGPG